MPAGLWKTYTEAAQAAPEGYVPVQQAGGWWGLQQSDAGISDYQQQQLQQGQEQWQGEMDWYRQQAEMQQAEQERQYKSEMLRNPMSWLQYNAYTGETPVVQEWMKPLGQSSVGQAIEGWNPNVAEGMPMSSLPQLTTPSAQLWSRMGPTAQQQFQGYRQTRTGQTPEETMFRQRAGAAPSGGNRGLRWLK